MYLTRMILKKFSPRCTFHACFLILIIHLLLLLTLYEGCRDERTASEKQSAEPGRPLDNGDYIKQRDWSAYENAGPAHHARALVHQNRSPVHQSEGSVHQRRRPVHQNGDPEHERTEEQGNDISSGREVAKESHYHDSSEDEAALITDPYITRALR